MPRTHGWTSTTRVLAAACALSACLCAPCAAALSSQAPSDTPAASIMELRLTDGSVIYGIVQSESAAGIVVRTLTGVTMTVTRSQVASLRPARGEVVAGRFRPADANSTRLLFSPTGRTLPKGEGYVGVYELLLPFVQVGVTDRFSVGAGTPLTFFGDDSGRLIWLTPKYQVHRGPLVNAAVGVMHFVALGEDVRAGLAYGVATIGRSESAWTVGAGWAYARYEEDVAGSCPPVMSGCTPDRRTETPGSAVLMVGGEHRISRRVKLLTENYLFREGGIISAGVRFMGDRLSADLGLFTPISTGELFAAPIVNFVWTFGR